MRISDWSSDVCSSDLQPPSSATIRSAIPLRMARLLIAMTLFTRRRGPPLTEPTTHRKIKNRDEEDAKACRCKHAADHAGPDGDPARRASAGRDEQRDHAPDRSEEHTSELQSLMRISYAV